MKVGILGSGVVAQALASGFIKHRHEVTMGTRSPAKLAEWVKQHIVPKARIFPCFHIPDKRAELP